MILLITGASHTGKTLLSQKLMEKYHIPYLSIDHLKMGLIRSRYTTLTPSDDTELEAYLWPILREMIKTVIENHQNLIIEGCYIPFDWQKDFTEDYRKEIQAYCLVMSEQYIHQHFNDIKQYANAIEQRMDDSWTTLEFVLEENKRMLELCKKHDFHYVLIDDQYPSDLDLIMRK